MVGALRHSHRVVKETGDHSLGVHAEVSKNTCDRNRVDDVRFPALAFLPVVRLPRDRHGGLCLPDE